MMKINASYQWSVSEAKSKLSEVLRRARELGPQYIGVRNSCVVVSREQWEKANESQGSVTQWLIDNSPKTEIPLPKRGNPSRPIPFAE